MDSKEKNMNSEWNNEVKPEIDRFLEKYGDEIGGVQVIKVNKKWQIFPIKVSR